MSDMFKFTVIFTVVLYIFVGSFYLALRAGVSDIDMSTGDIVSDLEVFTLETLCVLHVIHTNHHAHTLGPVMPVVPSRAGSLGM